MSMRDGPEGTLLASETFFDTLQPEERMRLVRLCAHLTGDSGVAEDLAQETLLEAWRNQQKFSPADLASPAKRAKWLAAIARNVCLRWGRSYGRERAHLTHSTLSAAEEGAQTPDLDELPSATYDLEIELERSELAQLLDRALALLPPTIRSVLIERYIHESSHAEIAEHFNLSEDALVQRLYRGKLALRRVIETDLHAEAAAYGLVEPQRAGEELLEQETRIWCPMCNKRRLVKYHEPASGLTGFSCPNCWHIAGLPQTQLREGLRSPRSILNHELTALSAFYWSAINSGKTQCVMCGQLCESSIVTSPAMPNVFDHHYGDNGYHGVFIYCSHCGYQSSNPLPHLTIDVPESQRFWRRYPRMLWLPEREISYAGQPALLSGFQSATSVARLDIIYHRETLKILGIHETSC